MQAESIQEFAVINNQCSVNTENESVWRNQGFLPLPNPKGKLPDTHMSWVNKAEPREKRQTWWLGDCQQKKITKNIPMMKMGMKGVWNLGKKRGRRKKQHRSHRTGRRQQEIPSTFSWPFVLHKKWNITILLLSLSHATPPSLISFLSLILCAATRACWARCSERWWRGLKIIWQLNYAFLRYFAENEKDRTSEQRRLHTSCLPAGHIQSGF